MWIKSRCLGNEDVHVFGYGACVGKVAEGWGK